MTGSKHISVKIEKEQSNMVATAARFSNDQGGADNILDIIIKESNKNSEGKEELLREESTETQETQDGDPSLKRSKTAKCAVILVFAVLGIMGTALLLYFLTFSYQYKTTSVTNVESADPETTSDEFGTKNITNTSKDAKNLLKVIVAGFGKITNYTKSATMPV